MGPDEETVRILTYPPTSRIDNPYPALMADALRKAGARVEDLRFLDILWSRPDVLHVHWPEYALWARWSPLVLLRLTFFISAVELLRRRGCTIAWTVHNLGSHDAGHWRLGQFVHRFVAARADLLLPLSHHAAKETVRRFPMSRNTKSIVVPHGHYRGQYPRRDQSSPDSGRISVVFFGRIRAYKGVEDLIGTFRRTDVDAELIVAGKPYDLETRNRLVASASGDRRIRVIPEYIADEDVADLLDSASLVVLPYRDVLHSGSALLALSHDRPLLAPAVGAFPELAAQVGDQWIRLYEGELDTDDLEAAIAWATKSERPRTAPLEAFDWDQIGGETYSAMRRVIREIRNVGSDSFFIAGMPRSGTTLLAELLTRHPEVQIARETHFFPESHARVSRLMSNGRSLDEVLTAVLSAEGFPYTGLSDAQRSQIHAENSSIRNPAHLLLEILRAVLPSTDKLGEKTPRHLEWAHDILSELPGCQLIVVIRDPRDVCASLRKVPWAHSELARHAIRWRRYGAMTRSAAARWPDRVLVCRFEDLVRSPSEEYVRICTFLGISRTPLPSAPSAQTFEPELEPWKAKAAEAIDAQRAGQWRDTLSPSDVQRIETLTGGIMKRLGYIRSTPTDLTWYSDDAALVSREFLSQFVHAFRRHLVRLLWPCGRIPR